MPPRTGSPGPFSAGSDSPVTSDSSTAASPSEFAVERDPFARPYEEPIAGFDRLDRDRLAVDPPGLVDALFGEIGEQPCRPPLDPLLVVRSRRDDGMIATLTSK